MEHMYPLQLEDLFRRQMSDVEIKGYAGVIYLYHKLTNHVIVHWTGPKVKEKEKHAIECEINSIYKESKQQTPPDPVNPGLPPFPKDVEVKAEPVSPIQNDCKPVASVQDVVINSVSLSPLLSRLDDFDMLSNSCQTSPCRATHTPDAPVETNRLSGQSSQLSAANGYRWNVGTREDNSDFGGLHVIQTDNTKSCTNQAVEKPSSQTITTDSLGTKQLNTFRNREEQRLRRNELARKGMQRLRERRRMNRLQQKLNVSHHTNIDVGEKVPAVVSYTKPASDLTAAEAAIQRLGAHSLALNAASVKRSVSNHTSKELLITKNASLPEGFKTANKRLSGAIPRMQDYHKGLKDLCYNPATVSGASTNLGIAKLGRLPTMERYTNNCNLLLADAQQMWQNLVNDAEEKRRKRNEYARESMRRLRQQRRLSLFQQNLQQYNKTKNNTKQEMLTVGHLKPPLEVKTEKITLQPTLLLSNQNDALQRKQKSRRRLLAEEERLKRNQSAREGMRRLRERRRVAQSLKSEGQEKLGNSTRSAVNSSILTGQPKREVVEEVVDTNDLDITRENARTQERDASAFAVTKQNEEGKHKSEEQIIELGQKQVNSVHTSSTSAQGINNQGRWLLPS